MQPHMMQVPHHGSRRNVTPTVLNQWLGGFMPKDQSCGTAICSVGEEKESPRGQVSNAFLRRGFPVYCTRGSALLHHSGGNKRGWGNSSQVPFQDKVEDKTKSAVAA